MTRWRKNYRWIRTPGDEADIDGKKLQDYAGYDGEEYIGRIFFERAGPTNGLWRWAGLRPKALNGTSPMPDAGYKLTAEDAARSVEEYWDAMKARQGG